MKILIIGCGNMGGGIAQRLSPHHEIMLYDRNVEKLKRLEAYGKACVNVTDGLKDAEIVILAVKPQNLKEAAQLIGDLQPSQTLISILAGIPIAVLRRSFPSGEIIRMMPNLALIYGEGMIGMTSDKELSMKEKERWTDLCKPLGEVFWLPESKMDAFTSLTSSGPAFVFSIIEAMVEAGIGMGFSAKDTQNMVHQMIRGSITLLEKTGKHPSELKWQIASPGGATIAGLKRFEECSVRSGIINTFFAAHERAQKMSLDDKS